MVEQSVQLPIISSVKEAVLNGFLHIDIWLKTLAVWLVIYVVMISVFMIMGGGDYFDGMTAQNILSWEYGLSGNLNATQNVDIALAENQLKRDLGGVYIVYSIANILIICGAACSMAVAWHQYLLLAVLPAWFGLGKREVLYFLFAVFLTLIWYAALYGAEIMPIIGGGLLILLVMILLPILGARVLIVLPAIAVSDKRFTYNTIWKITKNNMWRIAIGLLLMAVISLPITALALAMDLIYIPGNIKLPLQLFLHLLAVSFIMSYLSICYRYFAKMLDEQTKVEGFK